MQNSLCLRFLDWYPPLADQSGKKFVCRKTSEFFSDRKNASAWDYVLYEPGNTNSWLAVQTAELAITVDTRNRFEFWQGLCPDISYDLETKGVAGSYGIHLPKFTLEPDQISEFRQAFTTVMAGRQKVLESNDFADIGEYMAEKFPKWPLGKSVDMIEFHQWSVFGRPEELLVQKIPGSIAKVSMLVSPNEVFQLDGGKMSANEALKLAREKGAAKTILLFPASLPGDGKLVQSSLQLLNKELISSTDEMYLLNMTFIHIFYTF